MYQQLKGMGEEITEDDFMSLILASLPKSYQLLINTISLQNHATPKAIKPSIIMESILEEIDQLQIEDSESKAAENAMMVKGSKGKGKKKKNPTHSSGKSTNPDIECWNCSKKGHIRSKYPKKAKKKQTSSKEKDQEAHTTQAQEDYAFSFNVVGEALSKMINEDIASQITIHDSGASAHMSPNQGRFTDFSSIEPKVV